MELVRLAVLSDLSCKKSIPGIYVNLLCGVAGECLGLFHLKDLFGLVFFNSFCSAGTSDLRGLAPCWSCEVITKVLARLVR